MVKTLTRTRLWFEGYRARRMGRFGLELGATLVLLVVVLLASTDFDKLPNMQAIEDTQLRKTTFFGHLEPIVAARNAMILEQRDELAALAQNWQQEEGLSFLDRYRLKSLAGQYDVEWNDAQVGDVIAQLRQRIDAVPVSLVLVQAAKESGWGTSRFAREGNNLFGQWCYTRGCGIVPENRPSGARHEVREFSTVADAIDAYLHNINTSDAYRSLREIRARLRRAGKTPDGKSLADGLLYYSQRREAYVQEVKRMLDQYERFQRKQNG